MRTLFCLFAAFLLSQPLFAQSSTITGTVAIFNSQFETGKREFVANAQVEDDYKKSNATITDAGGHFKLSLVGIKDQEKVFYSVKKQGLEVVNIDALQAVAGQSEATRVFMAPEGKIAENKLKYYKINREASEKALTEKLKSLEKQIAAAQSDAVRLKGLQEEYGRLQAQFDKIEETARDLAERYARTNLDDVSADYQRAFRCFQRGQLDSALLIFKAIDLEADAAGIISEQGRNADLAAEYARRDSEKNKRKRETNEALRFKAQLHQTKFEFLQVEKTYDLLLRLDSTNQENLIDYTSFLQGQNRHAKSIFYGKKSLAYSDTDGDKATAMSFMGLSYYYLNLPVEAEKYCLQAFEIFERLVRIDPGQYGPAFITATNNLGVFYKDNGRHVEAEKNLLHIFDALKKAAEVYPKDMEYYLAQVANNLGIIYMESYRFPEAEGKYLLTYDIFERLAKEDPNQFESKLAMITTNLGNLYSSWNRFDDAETKHLMALEIYDRLSKKDSAQFKPYLATVANNLGNLYSDKDRSIEAEKSLLLAFSTYQQLAYSNPAQFEYYLARTAHNLAKFYALHDRIEKAKKNFELALEIFERLAKNNPHFFEPMLASTTKAFGIYLIGQKDFSNAIRMLEKSLAINREMATINPPLFELEIASTLFVLGITRSRYFNFADGQQNLKEAKQLALKYRDIPPAQKLLSNIDKFLKE